LLGIERERYQWFNFDPLRKVTYNDNKKLDLADNFMEQSDDLHPPPLKRPRRGKRAEFRGQSIVDVHIPLTLNKILKYLTNQNIILKI
jgi:hypothetical protein